MNPGNLKYSSTHEWVKAEDGIAILGITDYAQGELGEIVFVEMPSVGVKFDKGDVFGTVESYKTVSDLVCPVSGEIVEINSALADSPQSVNESPYEDGWMVKIKMANPAELNEMLTVEQYEEVLKEH